MIHTRLFATLCLVGVHMDFTVLWILDFLTLLCYSRIVLYSKSIKLDGLIQTAHIGN